jgi:two-component system NtrC family sensor kinase
MDAGSLAEVSAVLLLMAGGLLVYRTFRERYLLAWTLGWFAFLLSRLAVEFSGVLRPPQGWLALAHIFFLAALVLFAVTIFRYTNHRRGLLPYGVVALVALDVAILRAVLWPHADPLRYLLQALYFVIAAGAAWELARFSWGRGVVVPWLLALSLLPLHLHESAAAAEAWVVPDTVLVLVLGLSMIMMVLDDAQARARRLNAVNAIAGAVTQAREFGPMMQAALAELRQLMEAKTAWFRLLEGDDLVLTEQVGLSEDNVQNRSRISARDSASGRALRNGIPAMIHGRAAGEEIRGRLRADGYDHVIVLPVRGKTSSLGVVLLGFAKPHSYTPDEMQFLEATVNQIGIAGESLRLLDQMLRSRRQWVNTFDSIKDGIFVHTPDYRILRANRAMLRRLGLPHHEVLERPCDAVLPRAGTWTGCPYCNAGAANFGDAPDPCFGGFSMVSTSSYSEDGDALGTVHVITDLSERHAAEERYRQLFEQVQEGVFISTPSGRLLDCNQAFVTLLGYDNREELLSLDFAHQIYASAEERDLFRREMATRGAVRNYEVTLRRKDGSLIKALETSIATRDARGKIVRYQGFLLDITEKKRAEDEIRRRNRELYALNAIAVAGTQSLDLDEILNVTLRHLVELFQADTGGVYLFDDDTQLLRRRAAHGHQRELPEVRTQGEFWEKVQRSHSEIITPQHLELLPQPVTEFVRAEGLQSWLWVIMWAKDKIIGLLGISCRSQRNFTPSDENLMIAIGRQVATTIDKVHLYEETCRAYDDLRRTQEQLLQSEKMSAVGQLISGVAHELNNPLTAILGYAQLLEQEPLLDRHRDFVEKLHRQAQRTHRIVQNLLSFARQRKPQKAEVDLRQVLEDTLALRDYDLKLNNIAVERDYQGPLPLAYADAHQIEQVFLNIINNAVDAMLDASRGGVLQTRIFAEHGFVCAEVRDTGPGIRDPKRVFDPFYTTKSIGKGTGLGLSICYGIVKEHGGEILAGNHPEGGAIFTVRLPQAAESGTAPATAWPASEPALLRGRVLIVDDELSVLEFEREVLLGVGAEVVAVDNGDEAVASLRTEDFDAILLDGKMPGRWDGPDIYRWVAENRPALERHILLTVSDLSDAKIRHFLETTRCPCIVKPFEVKDLLALTRRLLRKAERTVAPVD